MACDRPKLESCIVIRLGRRDVTEIFHAAEPVPDMDDFVLSSVERQEAEREKVAALSVFDSRKATAEQAAEILAPKRRVALRLDVDAIGRLPYDLHVCSDPLKNDPRPGAGAHALIENVWSDDDEVREDIRAELVVLAFQNPVTVVGASPQTA